MADSDASEAEDSAKDNGAFGSVHSDDDGSHDEEEAMPTAQLPGDLGIAEYQEPLSALPPRVVMTEESQIEVSSSPAYQCLDDLFQAGKLTGTRVAQLKAKYSQLHETLKSTRENEGRLLQEAKVATATLEKQKVDLDSADSFPEGANNTVSKMRQQLLKYRNELAEIEERQFQHEYKIECLEEDRKLMLKEYERMPKKGEMEKKIKDLQQSCEELKKEMAQRQVESKNLKEDLEAKKRQNLHDKKVFEQLSDEVEKLKGDLVDKNQEPVTIAKEAERLIRQKGEVDKRQKVLDDEYEAENEQLRLLENRRIELEAEKFTADTDLDRQRLLLDEKQRTYDALMREYDLARDEEAQLMGDKTALDLSLRHITMEKKNYHEVHSRKLRERDRDMRSLKKAELQHKVAEDALAHTRTIRDKAANQLESTPKDDGTLFSKRTELQKEVEKIKRALAQQNSLTAVEQVKVEHSIAEEGRLLYEQGDLRIEVVELTRLAAIKADEREQKARDFMRAETRFTRAVEDLKTRELQIHDHHKKFNEMQIRLREFAKLYDVIKNDRNKIVNLIQTSTQKSAEMKEKIKILANEMEILRTAVTQKERQLQKTRLRHMNSIVIRDSLRNELAKQTRFEEDMREKRKQQKMDIEKLNLMINHSEEQMTELRKKYEESEQHRNYRGIQLIERNEEVCIFWEKVNIQDTMVRNGNVELQAREEEIRFLKMQLAEEQRVIDLLRKSLPNKRHLEQELVTLQIQLAQCQDRMMELEKALENPLDETRVRFLEGHDPTALDMTKKIQELETRLAEKEEHLLEKELVFEQVTRLSDRVRKRASVGKEDTLDLAKTVNSLQAKIKDTTRKMMAVVSELSMNQAQCVKLQAMVKEAEGQLEQCYIRMERGEPPSDEIEAEWEKTMQREEKHRSEAEMKQMTAQQEEQYMLSGGAKTAAEPRPNAYIPDDESELPIPRPYGSHAPFRPQEPGTTMRHIRKPVPKPIEI